MTLEGAAHSFAIFTDHKNLQYLREAKRLNPCQARWALFTRFNFTMSYRPRSCNIKVDALSQLYALEDSTDELENIIRMQLISSPIFVDLTASRCRSSSC